MDNAIINFAAYENGNEFLGMADVTLPDLTFLTQTVSGAGLGGNVEAVMPLIDAMTLTLNFRTGEIKDVAVKHAFSCKTKTFKGGKLAPASTGDVSVEMAVDSWTCYVDGKKTIDVCPRTMTCYINGVDYLKGPRKALGK